MNMRFVSPSAVIGAALGLGSGWVGAYMTPTVPACSSSTCQVINASSGNLSAQATFEISGASVFVTLANTSTFDVTKPADVLTSLLFNLNYTDGTAVTLSAISALMTPHLGSNVQFDARTIDANLVAKICEGAVNTTAGASCTASDIVGGEWAYASGTQVSDEYTGFTKGIGSAGLDVFGNANFAGANLDGPVAVNGGQYGITSAGDNPNTNISGNGYNPVTQNAVQFKLDFTPDATKTLDLTASGALSAGFQYGTDRGNPFLTPAPGTLALFGLGMFGLYWMRRRAN